MVTIGSVNRLVQISSSFKTDRDNPVYGSIKPVFKDVYLDVLYQSVYLRWMQCASLLNTIKPSLRKQRRKGYLFSTNLCFYAHFYRHAKLYLVYFLANFQTAGTSRRLGAPLVETPSSQFNRNTVYLTETGLIYDCVKVLMWKSLSCFYVCPCWNNDTVCFHCLKASRDKKDVFAQRDSACFGALIICCPVASRGRLYSFTPIQIARLLPAPKVIL